MTTEGKTTPAGLILGSGEVRLWGMTARERLRRQYVRAGVEPSEEAQAGRGAVITLGDWVYDEALVATLARRPGSVLVTDDGRAVAAHVDGEAAEAASADLALGRAPEGLTVLSPAELAYNEALRKREAPVLAPLTRENVRAIEARTFAGSYKGVTDIVTKYVWPVPARIVTRWCAQAKLTPNMVTSAGFLLVLLAFWLFWIGEFGWGLLAGWIMTFLDTVDGKLARTTMTSSKWGNVFDHGIDLIHPPFWWWAWYVGCFKVGLPPPFPELTLGVILAGYVLQRLEEGAFMRLFGFHVHSWRPFDSFFRLITARRNPNMIVLTLAWLVGQPGWGLFVVGVWTAICLVVHLVQVLQAMAVPKGQVVSWLAR
ncbi:CDP-alcohol phosphatidyltransferase family protein [Phenylobacterium sp. VNQ135]|uniref:CDP-alcohol phosphatidyltransferase family protein n=1 Tax=Phenylobacterium sp. VNQ135 TaxID=3400922 RepID=UPI003C0D5A52